MAGKISEIGQELKQVLFKRAKLLDGLLPPILFLIAFSSAGFVAASLLALALAFILGVARIVRGQPIWYALGGAAGVGMAILLTRWSGREQGFFLPALASSVLTLVLCGLSLLVRRPLVAWTSFIARRWPLAWYWHPAVRPAYSEVTLLWMLYFGARLLLQLDLFRQEATGSLGLLNLILGWPATVALLIVSYLYGTWRLSGLGGPSVEEFRQGKSAPWESQQRGF